MIRGKRLLGLGVLVFCLLLWFLIIPNQTEGKTGAEFPRLIVLFLAIPGAVLLLRPGAATGAAPLKGEELYALRRTALLLALVCVYMLVIPKLGFYTSSILGMAAFLYCLGVRTPLQITLTPLISVGLMYLGLGLGLSFRMPAGLLP